MRIAQWIAAVALVASPWAVYGQATTSPIQTGARLSRSAGTDSSTSPPIQLITPDVTDLSPTFGTGATTLPTIGIPQMPPIGPLTSTIGIGAIGTPTIIGSTIASLSQMPLVVPTVPSTLSPISGRKPANMTISPSGGAASVTGTGSSVSGGGASAGSNLACLPEDFICGGSVVRP
jgi:hypothetical protein